MPRSAMRPNRVKTPRKPGRQYANGATAERQAKKLLEADGWIVGRFAGSKGPKGADLIAVKNYYPETGAYVLDAPHRLVLWVSCKKDAGRETRRAELAELPGSVEVWRKTARRGWEKERIK